MTDRELIGVFWGTVAAIPVILGIVWTVNRGLDQQERAERRERLDEITRLGQEIEDDHQTDAEGLCIDPRCMASRPRPSLTAAPRSGLAKASDSSTGPGGGGTSFQEQ